MAWSCVFRPRSVSADGYDAGHGGSVRRVNADNRHFAY
jgi:hypothetical protein